MATRDVTRDDVRTRDIGRTTTRREETKASLMTTEFYSFVAAVAAILIAAWKAANFDAPRAWTLVAAVTIGYMLSRGLAKSGSAHRDREDY
jgi:hypothetical protein